MNNHTAKQTGWLSLALTLACFSPQQAAADDNDPPGRVARLSFARGPVSFEPGGADEWVAARINRPMTTGDKLWTDAGALAEMNTGSAYIRIGANTGFSFLNLSDYATQLQLTEGTLLVRVRRLERNETFEIDTPNLAFSVYQTGAYEVTVNQAGDVTVVQVRQGQGEVTGGGASYSLQQGDEGRFAGTDGLEAEMSSYRSHSDEFENWSSQRDRRIDHSYSSKYVSPDVIGYEDLDQYGGWRSSGEYGNVWYPHTTEVGWAPYHNGHWAYIAPWGYTWVDDEPWGFAPFHYGRWINVQGAWGWVPGPRESEGQAYVRPVYAPALVAWVGGPHFAIGVSVGGGGGYSQGESVGWFPLGPREVYVPSYPVSRTYVNNVNISNTNVTNTVVNNYYNTTVVNNTNNSTNVNVTNVKYVNQTVPGAVTATTPQAFVSAQPVARNIVQVNQREIAAAPVRIAAPAVAPSREAVLGTTVQASAKPPEAVVNRTVVARVAPPPPLVPFVQQQKAIEANGGKPLPGSEIRQMQVQEQQQVQRGQQQQQQQQQQRAPSGQPAQAQQQAQQVHPAVRIAPPAQPQTARPAQAQANAGNPPAAAPNKQQDQNNRPPNQNTQQQQPQPLPQQGNPPGQPVKAQSNQPNTPSPQPQQANRSDQPLSNNANRPNTPNTPSGRPANTPDPALELKHQQELEQLHKQQDQERQRVEQQQLQERKLQEQKAAEQQRQLQQQAQKNTDQQQQAQKAQAQNAAEQQRQQQQQQAQRNADQQQQQAQKVQLQKVADQQRQQQDRNLQEQKAAEQQRQQLDQKHQQDLLQLEQKHAQEQQQLNQKHEQEHQQQARPQPPPPPQQRPQQQAPPPPPEKSKDKPPKDSRPPQRG